MLCAALIGEQVIVSFVRALFASRRPSAILWRVWASVVDAFDRMVAAWTWAHVREEGSTTGAPSIADGDPAASIRWEFRVVDVVTTRHHFPMDETEQLIFTISHVRTVSENVTHGALNC
jgi:hypothetical protein